MVLIMLLINFPCQLEQIAKHNLLLVVTNKRLFKLTQNHNSLLGLTTCLGQQIYVCHVKVPLHFLYTFHLQIIQTELEPYWSLEFITTTGWGSKDMFGMVNLAIKYNVRYSIFQLHRKSICYVEYASTESIWQDVSVLQETMLIQCMSIPRIQQCTDQCKILYSF